MVCLSCTGTGERVCLSAEGFGNRQCFLESIVDKVSRSKEDPILSKFPIFIILLFQNVPPDLSQCVFVIEQALSVRALQEIISSNDAEAVRKYFQLRKQLKHLLTFLTQSVSQSHIFCHTPSANRFSSATVGLFPALLENCSLSDVLIFLYRSKIF